jgi:hypothetical protein
MSYCSSLLQHDNKGAMLAVYDGDGAFVVDIERKVVEKVMDCSLSFGHHITAACRTRWICRSSSCRNLVVNREIGNRLIEISVANLVRKGLEKEINLSMLQRQTLKDYQLDANKIPNGSIVLFLTNWMSIHVLGNAWPFDVNKSIFSNFSINDSQ